MSKQKKILFIQHASGFGGSCMSLLYTMQNIDRERFEPIVALTNDSRVMIEFYEKAGFKTVAYPGITFWGHTTGSYAPLYRPLGWINLIKVVNSWKRGKYLTKKLVYEIKPDIVHLNSVVLSASAAALKEKKIPFIWHIREHPPKEWLGICTRIIRKMLLSLPDETIFLSCADRFAWVRNKGGHVIHNFVNFNLFNRNLNALECRRMLNITSDIVPVILYLGGVSKIKGAIPFVNALSILKNRLNEFRVIMPGAAYDPPDYFLHKLALNILPAFGRGTVGQTVHRLIKKNGLSEHCIILPFEKNVAPLIAACDVMVFPATVPHFARPVIEAGAMAKSVVASDLDGVREIVQNGKTGFLVKPNDPQALADALYKIFSNKDESRAMGEAGFRQAQAKFSAEKNCKQIMDIYDRILIKNLETKN